MAKNDVDGVYDKDPNSNPDATKYQRLTYLDAIDQRLGVMDSTALSLCMEHNVPIIVFDLFERGNLADIVEGKSVGTLVTDEK